MQKVSYNNHTPFTLEICVDSIQSARAAEKGGAKRIELCNSLTEGGTTPSCGLLEVIRENISIDIHVLIRPRRGDFLFSDLEFESMKRDIVHVKQLGANGVVLGILKRDGHIDVKRMRELVDLARPLNITFHRAFDLTPDPMKALNDLLTLQVDRLLTSGQQRTALLGATLIRDLIQQGGQEIIVMPGGGINGKNILDLVSKTGAMEFHTSACKKVESEMTFRRNYINMAGKPCLSEFEDRVSDPDEIRSILKAIHQGLGKLEN